MHYAPNSSCKAENDWSGVHSWTRVLREELQRVEHELEERARSLQRDRETLDAETSALLDRASNWVESVEKERAEMLKACKTKVEITVRQGEEERSVLRAMHDEAKRVWYEEREGLEKKKEILNTEKDEIKKEKEDLEKEMMKLKKEMKALERQTQILKCENAKDKVALRRGEEERDKLKAMHEQARTTWNKRVGDEQKEKEELNAEKSAMKENIKLKERMNVLGSEHATLKQECQDLRERLMLEWSVTRLLTDTSKPEQELMTSIESGKILGVSPIDMEKIRRSLLVFWTTKDQSRTLDEVKRRIRTWKTFEEEISATTEAQARVGLHTLRNQWDGLLKAIANELDGKWGIEGVLTKYAFEETCEVYERTEGDMANCLNSRPRKRPRFNEHIV